MYHSVHRAAFFHLLTSPAIHTDAHVRRHVASVSCVRALLPGLVWLAALPHARPLNSMAGCNRPAIRCRQERDRRSACKRALLVSQAPWPGRRIGGRRAHRRPVLGAGRSHSNLRSSCPRATRAHAVGVKCRRRLSGAVFAENAGHVAKTQARGKHLAARGRCIRGGQDNGSPQLVDACTASQQ